MAHRNLLMAIVLRAILVIVIILWLLHDNDRGLWLFHKQVRKTFTNVQIRPQFLLLNLLQLPIHGLKDGRIAVLRLIVVLECHPINAREHRRLIMGHIRREILSKDKWHHAFVGIQRILRDQSDSLA